MLPDIIAELGLAVEAGMNAEDIRINNPLPSIIIRSSYGYCWISIRYANSRIILKMRLGTQFSGPFLLC